MHMVMRAWRILLAVSVAAVGAVIVLSLLAPGLAGRIALAEWGQALAEAAGAAACAVAASHTRGRARLVWVLFATGQATWAATDALAGATVLLDIEVAEVSALDAGWLVFYVPMLGAVCILYRHLRPERGWQGLLDGLIVTVATAAVAWTALLSPLARDASGGLVGTLVALLYPALDMTCLAALGWIILRHGSRSPVWLRWVVAAFALQSAAGLAYVTATLLGHDIAVAAAGIYMAAGFTWVAAGLARRRAAERTWAAGLHDAPPVWSQTLPFVLGMAVVLLGVVRPEPELRIAAGVGAVLMGVRSIEALRVSRGLLAERDRLLVTDPLTGAFNRRFLAHESDRAFAAAERNDDHLAAIALDLDHFKSVNDRLGHGVGDQLLQTVARAIRSQLRASDLLCRLGGDEFLVLCPATDGDGALAVAERIRVQVRDCAQRLVPEIPVTTSLGIATFPADAADPADLMRAADDALYAAKALGRDVAARYVGPPPELVPG
jgi:two-component system, cell cycle response regulator